MESQDGRNKSEEEVVVITEVRLEEGGEIKTKTRVITLFGDVIGSVWRPTLSFLEDRVVGASSKGAFLYLKFTLPFQVCCRLMMFGSVY